MARGRRRSAFPRGDVPARSWCLGHRRDRHRLPPFEFGVNDQNAPWSVITLPAIAQLPRLRSARRHRQGPKAARERGRSEAQSLARCRAQIEHRSLMAGASVVVLIVVSSRAHYVTWCWPRACSQSAATCGPESRPVRVAAGGQIFPDVRDQIVWTMRARSAHKSARFGGESGTDHRHADGRHGTLTVMA